MIKNKKKSSSKTDNKNKKTAVVDDIKHRFSKEESDYSKVSTLLMDEKFKRRKTSLHSIRQVGLITTLDVIAQIYDIPFLKKYVDWYAEWMTSIDAMGRKDIVDISKFRFEENEKHQNRLMELARGGR